VISTIIQGGDIVNWEFQSDRPIYTQLVEQIKLRIISGVYKPGDKLPSVRDFAQEAAVNPNTMQRALAELEKDGLVYSQRTSGRFITEDRDMIKKVKDNLALKEITAFLEKMKMLGFDKEEMVLIMKNMVKEMEA